MYDATTLMWEIRVKNVGLLDVWHRDPKGDRGHPCGGRKYWLLHLHHIDHIVVPVVRKWYRKKFQRCSWCGGGWTKMNPVNLSTGAYGQGDEGTVHFKGDCLDKYRAERMRLENLRRLKSENI